MWIVHRFSKEKTYTHTSRWNHETETPYYTFSLLYNYRNQNKHSDVAYIILTSLKIRGCIKLQKQVYIYFMKILPFCYRLLQFSNTYGLVRHTLSTSLKIHGYKMQILIISVVFFFFSFTSTVVVYRVDSHNLTHIHKFMLYSLRWYEPLTSLKIRCFYRATKNESS